VKSITSLSDHRPSLIALALLLAAPVHVSEISEAGLQILPPADIVILGEVHDNPAHHANQAAAVAAIKPRALVFEMLTADQASRMPPDRSDAARVEGAIGWNASGWPDFAMYHPIFTAAPDARVFGGALPQGEVHRAVDAGAAEVFGADAARFGLSEPLDPVDQAEREADLAAAHCNALPADVLPGMVEAQRLRDAALARAAVEAMTATGGPVVVITGNGHARRDQGIPSVLALAAPQLRVLSVGQLEGPGGQDQPFDLWIVTGTVARGDPCAAFGTQTRLDRPVTSLPG
jgi:uncharacterized iron-regulated protein